MAYKLIWSPAARDDLHDIVIFIARDSPKHAMSFGYEVISVADQLQFFPEHGRVVPEYRNPDLREIIFAHTESSIELITKGNSVRLPEFGTRHGAFRFSEKAYSHNSPLQCRVYLN
jgi:plasmid stabilization system protein ParE